MAVRTAEGEWKGGLKDGAGQIKLGSGAFTGAYTFKSRMEDGVGTNPEELLGAAHAGCFSMALSATLAGAGFEPKRVHTTAKVYFGPVEGGFAIGKIELVTEAEVPGIDDVAFQQLADGAKKGCPISKALASVPISLDAKLI
jgi:osmotically inducible protein OsmC